MKTEGPQPGSAVGQAKPRTPAMAMKDALEGRRVDFERYFSSPKAADRFMRILTGLPMMNPGIVNCTLPSIIKAAALCAQDRLEPDGRHAALVPFKKGDVSIATYMPMVHGIIRRAFETGEFRTIAAREVFDKDIFEYQYDFDTSFRHVPAEGERGPLKGVYAFYVLKNGGRDFVYMSLEDCEAHGKKYSKSFNDSNGPWKQFPLEMYKKTAIKRVLHFAPTSMELPEDEDSTIRNVTPAPTFEMHEAPPATVVEPEAPAAHGEQRRGPFGVFGRKDAPEKGKLDVETGERDEPPPEDEGQQELF